VAPHARPAQGPRPQPEAPAFASGLDRSYLGAISRGEKNVSLINIRRIADALGVGAGKLFRDPDPN
jgi:transcriptional regulator with XRE-family HTH domain